VVITSFGSTRKAIILVPRSIVPTPVIRTRRGRPGLRSVVVAWPFSIRNEAESWVRSVVCSLPSCHPDSVARGQRADHLRDVEAPDLAVLEIGEQPVPLRFDMIAALAFGHRRAP